MLIKKIGVIFVVGDVKLVPIVKTRALKLLVVYSNPIGLIMCKDAPVAAQVRAILPVFCGISGS